MWAMEWRSPLVLDQCPPCRPLRRPIIRWSPPEQPWRRHGERDEDDWRCTSSTQIYCSYTLGKPSMSWKIGKEDNEKDKTTAQAERCNGKIWVRGPGELCLRVSLR